MLPCRCSDGVGVWLCKNCPKLLKTTQNDLQNEPRASKNEAQELPPPQGAPEHPDHVFDRFRALTRPAFGRRRDAAFPSTLTDLTSMFFRKQRGRILYFLLFAGSRGKAVSVQILIGN